MILTKKQILTVMVSAFAGMLWAEPFRTYVATNGAEACGAVLSGRPDGSILCRGRGWCCLSYNGGRTWHPYVRDTSADSVADAPSCLKKDPFTGWMFFAGDGSCFGADAHRPHASLSLSVSQNNGKTWKFVCDIENNSTNRYGCSSLHFTEKAVVVSYCEAVGSGDFIVCERRCKVTVLDRGEMMVGKDACEPLGYPKGSRWRYWKGVDNVRDLGGLKTNDGRTLKKGMIYRSQALNDNAVCSVVSEACMRSPSWLEMDYGVRNAAELRARIDPNDVTGSCARISQKLKADKDWWRKGELRGTVESRRKVLEETGIKTELDLRSDAECWGMTGSPLGPTVRWLHMPCKGVYIEWFVRSEGKAFFARCFREFLSRENYPFDIHCIAGADRTGCVVALLTGILGVTDKEIENDYVMTSLSSSGHRSRERFRERMKALTAFSGKTFAERAVAYAEACGITRDEINAFRAIMIQ